MNVVKKETTALLGNTFNKKDCEIGIVHVGIGAFHRAHQAAYINHLLNYEGQQHWGIAGVNLREQESPLIAQLHDQGHSYVLKTLSPDNQVEYQKIDSILTSFDWPSDKQSAANIVAKSSVHLITMTVTESGYYLSDDGVLDTSAAQVKAGLSGEGSCIYTFLRAALNVRKSAYGMPITLLSCDNLRHNGNHLQKGFEQFLKACDDLDLLEWVNRNVSFPCSMVDRITPRIEKAASDEVQEKFAVNDHLTVVSESFSQWIVENNFAGFFPPLHQVGVKIVNDVEPYEDAKIRILNGGHTIVVYLAALKGHTTYDEAIADPELDALFTLFQGDEVIPAIEHSPIDLKSYSETVKLRFSNKNISDSIERISADGVSKFSIFILVTLFGSYQRGVIPQQSLKGIAAWYVFMSHVHEGLVHFEYVEPKWEAIKSCLKPGGESEFVKSSLIWGSLPKDYPEFCSQLLQSIVTMKERFPV